MDQENHLTTLSDTELHESTIRVACRDREAQLETIEHLREVARRRLYAKRGFSSLFSYAVSALGFSEPAASQRIQALRLTESVPVAKAKLESGELSFSGAAELQKFIRKEEKAREQPMSKEEKERILSEVSGKSFRETGRVLLSLTTHPEVHALKERERPVAPNRTELRFFAGPEMIALLERVRELRGHSSLEDIFQLVLSAYLNQMDPLRRKSRQTRSPKAPESQARYVPAAVKRELHRRSASQCEWVDAVTARRCEGRHRLEVDHLVPFALGGATVLENLALHCRSHNTLRAIEAFGEEEMGRYLRVSSG